MLSIIRVFFIFGILAHSQSNIKCAGQREFYCKTVLFDIVRKFIQQKVQKMSNSGYCSVDLGALPIMIHILIDIIPVHVLFVFILPLIEIARKQFCKVDGM